MGHHAKPAALVLWPVLASLLASCASAPVGGPTKYALDRAAKAGDAGEGGDELRFGLLCSGYFCSESYKISGLSFVPLVGGAYPDKPNTPKLFSQRRPYKNLIWLKSFGEPQDSDVIVKLTFDRGWDPVKADVVSVYSKRSLYQVECQRCLPAIGAAIYDHFKPGSTLYKAVSAEREAALRPTVSLSKTDLESIANVVLRNGPAQKETAVPAMASDVDKPDYSLPENPDYFALVVGIEKYSDLPTAQFAERDAEAVKAHLLALGYPSRNVVFLAGEKAGRAGIEKYLERWLPRNVGENSRVFFYFSGHGAPEVKSGEAYLVPWDGDASFLENTGYPIRRLYQMLGTLKAQDVIVAMDACFSGAGGRSVLAQGARPLVAKIESAVPESAKIISFSAASGSEVSGVIPEQGHGAFTYYFLKGLGGAARDSSGRVTAQALHNYLVPKVEDAARRQNRDQTPQLMPSALGARAQTVLR